MTFRLMTFWRIESLFIDGDQINIRKKRVYNLVKRNPSVTVAAC